MIARSKLEVSARAVPTSEGVRSLVSYILEVQGLYGSYKRP